MTEYEYKQQCKKINEQIKPSDEFVERMKKNIEQELQKRQNKQKYKFEKIAASFIAITLLSTGAAAFADDIGNLFTKIFKNSDPSINLAIENGYVQNVDMDYVEHDGIGMKVNSIIVDDNKVNIILDVKGEIDGIAVLNYVSLEGLNKDIIKDLDDTESLNTSFESKWKSIDKNNYMFVIQISNLEKNIFEYKNLKMTLENLDIYKDDKIIKSITDKWEYNIEIDSEYFVSKNDNVKYIIKNNETIKDYRIELCDTLMNLQIELKEDLQISKIIRENIIIIDENGKEYNCKEFSKIVGNKILMNIPLTVYNKVDKFKIFINLESQAIELNIEKQKG